MIVENVSLDTLAQGAIVEVVNRELQRIAENIQDINTEPKAKRQITVKLVFAPADDRQNAVVSATTEVKLAPLKGVGTTVYLRKKDGRLQISEFQAEQENLFPTTLERT